MARIDLRVVAALTAVLAVVALSPPGGFAADEPAPAQSSAEPKTGMTAEPSAPPSASAPAPEAKVETQATPAAPAQPAGSTAESKPAEAKPADIPIAGQQAEETKPAEVKPAETVPVESKAAETQPPAKPAPATLIGVPVRSWGYQLQNDNVDEIAASPYDVIVMDYSRESTQDMAFTPGDLAKMKVKPDGSRRIILSYISIGEAESYRYYWTERGWSKKSKRPKWIGAENPEWKGNYTVNFWEEGWQDIILNDDDSYMNRIMKAGFDGVYLDKIDIAYDLMGKSPKGTDSIDLMIDFVVTISETLKAKNPEFLIFPQNAEGLLSNPEYRKAVDGIGKEDLLFREEAVDGGDVYKDGFPNPPKEIDESVGLLKQLKADGRTILVVEYLHSAPDIKASARKFADWGFISYFGPRDLGRLVPVSEQPKVAAAPQTKPEADAAHCAGLAEEACSANRACAWLPGYEASPGTEIAGRCRNAPRSAAPRHKVPGAGVAAGAAQKPLSSRAKGLRMRGSDER